MKVPDDMLQARDQAAHLLINRPGVVAVGIELDQNREPTVAVHLETEAARKGLPAKVDGYRLTYKVTGPLKAFQG